MSMTNSNVEATQDMVIEGYALTFNTLSNDLGGFKERILPNALDDVDIDDVKCLINHEDRYVIGRTQAGTLELSVDNKGLKFKCWLPQTSYAKDIYENIDVGNVNECSFHAWYLKDNNGKTTGFYWTVEDGDYVMNVEKFEKLIDVSIVTTPAYKDTGVLVAQRSQDLTQAKELEKLKISIELDGLRFKT